MGMYTQIRGWLNVDSIGDYEGKRYKEIEKILMSAKERFQRDTMLRASDGSPLERKWVCDDTFLHMGGNGSCYMFFGTELKNYGNPAGEWIKYLLDFFPNAEGRIDFQYEEDEDECIYWLIHKGKIVKEDNCDKWCEGYGNMWK